MTEFNELKFPHYNEHGVRMCPDFDCPNFSDSAVRRVRSKDLR